MKGGGGEDFDSGDSGGDKPAVAWGGSGDSGGGDSDSEVGG